ncbi:MAG: hypothetical protein AAGD07_13030 [Planctomycetota bacterium]
MRSRAAKRSSAASPREATRTDGNPITKAWAQDDFHLLLGCCASLGWDRLLAKLQRFRARMGSRRTVAGSFAIVAFVASYLVMGVLVLSHHQTSDPMRLRAYLTGGLVLYLVFHAVRQSWSQLEDPDSELSAETLWIGGGPIDRRYVVLRRALASTPACATKAGLLCVILFRNVPSVFNLFLGVFIAFLTLEWCRVAISNVLQAMSVRDRKTLQWATTLMAAAITTQLLYQVWVTTPPKADPIHYAVNTLSAIGTLTESPSVQWLGIPFHAAAQMAIGRCLEHTWVTGVALHLGTFTARLMTPVVSLAVLGLSGWGVIATDKWARRRRFEIEKSRLDSIDLRTQIPTNASVTSLTSSAAGLLPRMVQFASSMLPQSCSPAMAVMWRQAVCVQRYRVNVVASFAIPMVLSLSPLATDLGNKQWLFVIGGIALSSLLLAPPALQIDFRRDLRRMLLLRGMPVSTTSLAIGMLSLPVALTTLFQWTTLTIAAAMVRPEAVTLTWLFLSFPALSIVTFALENALFLTFPHHIGAQGIFMVIRAKGMFLWKGSLLMVCPLLVVLYKGLSQAMLPNAIQDAAMVLGTVATAWILAIMSVAWLIRCWARFDPLRDTPAPT